MACASCKRSSISQDVNATGYNPNTGTGKCPCGRTYSGYPLPTCPFHYNKGYRTIESVIELIGAKEEKEIVAEEQKEVPTTILDEKDEIEIIEVVEEKPKKKKATKKTSKKKTASKKKSSKKK